MSSTSRVFAKVFVCGLALFAPASSASYADGDWSGAKKTGGALTVYSFGESPYNHAAPFLELEERRAFSNGTLAFRTNYLIDGRPGDAGSPLIKADYNGRSCESCHLRDGRGVTHAHSLELTGFSVKASSGRPVFRNTIVPDVSKTLQDVEWETRQRIVLEGQVVELVAPVAIVDGQKTTVDLRNAPAVYGLGLLEAIADADIRTTAEKQEFGTFGVKGILGRACENSLDPTCDRIGRFGWKADVFDLNAQTRSALADELGIHQPIPNEVSLKDQTDYDRLVADLSGYLKVLAVPARRIDERTDNASGARLFAQAGCTMCHRPSWQTDLREGVDSRVRGQQIYPFTDLLLHDMGEGLADGNGDDLSRYWRTAALWGIGMQPTVADKAGYLHDGRARNFLEAILWHGGEAAYSLARFRSLSKDDRDQLLSFLSSL